MSCQCCVIAHNDIVAELAIVGDMAICHDQVVIADFRDKPACFRSAVQGCEFPDIIVVADDEFAFFTMEF